MDKQKSHYDLRNWSDNNNDGVKDNGLNSGNGVLKDKVRTFRYQLSNEYYYTDRNDMADTDLPESQDDIIGEENFLGNVCVDGDIVLPVYCDNMQLALRSKFIYQDNATVEDSNN